MEQKEIWKSVVGYEGLYEVSNLGNVRSLGRRIVTKAGRPMTKYPRALVPKETRQGYLRVGLTCSNKMFHSTSVHRLVAIAFIDNPNSLPQVNHIDGIKYNNHVDNLEWITARDNQLHAVALGLQVSMNNKHPYKRVINIFRDGVFVKSYNGIREAARNLSIDHGSFTKILRFGKSYKGLTFQKGDLIYPPK